MDYLQHFGLNDDPFRNDPLERYQLEVPSQQDALRRIDRGVRQNRSLVVLTGGVGAGKSCIVRKLFEELEEEVFEASMMVVLRGSVDTDWLLGRFAAQFGVEDPPSEREALIAQIYERLAIIREDGRHAVLIIDDAHALAVSQTLHELFALVKLEYEDRRLLTVVLSGAPRLAEVIDAEPDLAEQVEVRVDLAPFSPDETAGYLGQRVQVAGGREGVLLPGSVAALHELSEGRPGRINALADNALYESFLAGRSEVARSDVERAHADLGWRQGPARRSTDRPAVRASAARSDARPAAPAVAAPTAPAEAELTIAGPGAGALSALDSELEAVFEPQAATSAESLDLAGSADASSSGLLMDFESSEATRSAASAPAAEPTELQLEVLDAPPKDGDEVDDLFMELLDE